MSFCSHLPYIKQFIKILDPSFRLSSCLQYPLPIQENRIDYFLKIEKVLLYEKVSVGNDAQC
jgi:hypothetical protein